MKLRVSISVAAGLLAVVCLCFILAPQKFLFDWAIGRVFPDATYHLDWVNGVAELDELQCTWPSLEVEKDWKTSFALSILKDQPFSIHQGTVIFKDREYHLSGAYSPDRSHLVLSQDGNPIITLEKEEGPYVFSFTNAPLYIVSSFAPTSDFSGIISKGYVDENGRGNLEIVHFGYKQDQFALHIPKAVVELNGNEAKVLGISVTLSHDNKQLWTLNPVPMQIKLEEGFPFVINANSTIQFVDRRFHISSYIKNLKAEGALKPAKVDILTFNKSTLRPNDKEALLQGNHVASCDYKSGEPSFFSIVGNEVRCELKMDKEKTFLVELSKPFLEQFGMHQLPLQQMTGKIESDGGFWHLAADMQNGKLNAYVSSFLIPQISFKEAYLTLDEWPLLNGPVLQQVSLHFYPEKTIWKANFEGIAFHGTGNFNDKPDIQFAGSGRFEEWKKVLAKLNPKSALLNCPMDGMCSITEGTISGDAITFDGRIENGSLASLHDLNSKIHYENGYLDLKDLSAKFEYRGQPLSVFAPTVTLSNGIEFDGWVADQSQDYIRLAGNGIFLGNELMLEFDTAKTHLFNIVPSFFTLALKDWTKLDRLVFRGKGMNKASLFDDINRWTQNEEWNIALNFEQDGNKNHFEVHKGSLSILGSMQTLTQYRVEDVSLELPSLSLSGAGLIDLNQMLVQLDPVEIDVDFSKNPMLTSLPIEGHFSAVGVAFASPNATESWLEVKPNNLAFGLLAMPDTPFQLHQKGEEFNFHCNYLLNHTLLTGFDCLLNKGGLKAKNGTTSFFIGSTHFGIDKAGLCVRGRHSPTFALTEPLKTEVEIVKSFLPFTFDQLKGGTLYINDGHCSINDTCLLGKEINQIEFDFDAPQDQNLLLKNIALKNDGESIAIQLATLSFNQGQLKKVSFPALYASNVSFSPLLIKNISLANFESEWPFKEFTGKGKLSFSNLLPMLSKHLDTEEIAELSHIEAKWFLPNQGEFSFEASNNALLIQELKDCFSSGKMIRFELNPENEVASVNWDGTLNFPLKLKPQHLSFKWSELFSLKLEGSLFEPHLELKKK